MTVSVSGKLAKLAEWEGKIIKKNKHHHPPPKNPKQTNKQPQPNLATPSMLMSLA